jgi:hypothetical protein
VFEQAPPLPAAKHAPMKIRSSSVPSLIFSRVDTQHGIVERSPGTWIVPLVIAPTVSWWDG